MTTAASTKTVLFVCTGNAARSVIGAAVARRDAPHLNVTSAGTHSIPGLPMSVRTRSALEGIGALDPDHRSRQLDEPMSAQADLVVVFEPMHIAYIRREHSAAAARAASLPRLARDLPAGPLATLSDRVRALKLEDQDFEPWEEVVDPAGGQLAEFEAAAAEIVTHLDVLMAKLGR